MRRRLVHEDGLAGAGTLAEENGMRRLCAGASCLCPWCVSADLSTRVQQRGRDGDGGMHCDACHGIQPPARARTLTLTSAWIVDSSGMRTRSVPDGPLTPSFLPAVAHRAKNTWPKFEQERVFGLHTCKRVKSPASGSKYTGKKYYLHTTIGN